MPASRSAFGTWHDAACPDFVAVLVQPDFRLAVGVLHVGDERIGGNVHPLTLHEDAVALVRALPGTGSNEGIVGAVAAEVALLAASGRVAVCEVRVGVVGPRRHREERQYCRSDDERHADAIHVAIQSVLHLRLHVGIRHENDEVDGLALEGCAFEDVTVHLAVPDAERWIGGNLFFYGCRYHAAHAEALKVQGREMALRFLITPCLVHVQYRDGGFGSAARCRFNLHDLGPLPRPGLPWGSGPDDHKRPQEHRQDEIQGSLHLRAEGAPCGLLNTQQGRVLLAGLGAEGPSSIPPLLARHDRPDAVSTLHRHLHRLYSAHIIMRMRLRFARLFFFAITLSLVVQTW